MGKYVDGSICTFLRPIANGRGEATSLQMSHVRCFIHGLVRHSRVWRRLVAQMKSHRPEADFWSSVVNRTLERTVTWIFLALLCGFVLVLSFGLIEPFFSGQIAEATKHPRGVKFSLADEPAKFWNAWGAHALFVVAGWAALVAGWKRTASLR